MLKKFYHAPQFLVQQSPRGRHGQEEELAEASRAAAFGLAFSEHEGRDGSDVPRPALVFVNGFMILITKNNILFS